MIEVTRDPTQPPPLVIKLDQETVDALYTEGALMLEHYRRSYIGSPYREDRMREFLRAISPYLSCGKAFPSGPI